MKLNQTVSIVATLLPALLVSTVAFAADAVTGEALFKAKCAVCHAVEQGKNKMGPSLFGVVGRPSGSAPEYRYSPAMLATKLTWDKPTLDTFLTNPQAMVKGTKMGFFGDKNDGERADLIAYLETLK